MNPYMNTWSSLMNIVKRFIEANPDFNIVEGMDFDANVEINEYPAGNLVGIYQVDYTESGPLIYVQCAFPVSITSSEDVIKLNQMAGKLAAFVRNETRHPFYHYESGAPVGLMIARDELAISPISKTTNRQFKFILQGFIVDRTATFQPT